MTRAIVREFEFKLNDDLTEKAITIAIKDDNGLIMPSPLGNFIKSEYINKGLSLQSQKNAAETIVRMINYIYKRVENGLEKELRHYGFSAITLEHAAQYITDRSYCTRLDKNHPDKLTSNYILSEINYINNFFYWLEKQKLLKQNYKVKTEKINYIGLENNRVSKIIKLNVFDLNDVEILYPKRRSSLSVKLKDFGEKRETLISDFIYTALRIEPGIAFGIALEMLGGLRRGEVVNLMQSSIKKRNNMFIVEIRDNQKELFTNSSSTSDVQVKNERDQICLCTDLIEYLYDHHIKYLSRIHPKKNNGLFISSKTNLPLSGSNFSEKFNKVKQEFLKDLLEKQDFENYKSLISKPWSTHIGRGIFTNILLNLGVTASQLALLRGDKNITSALSYIDEFSMINAVQNALNEFHLSYSNWRLI
ncbi:site-specific integrase [Ureibacillus chungkukjangi]|uniref:site-specific integrase n=1 Tax=Ureibacillus chungkukjangi TaxID=1202712 RepID=UPI000D3ACB87|nr:site-specific integrase [Ureibacillus chungkukjangi]